MHAPTIAFAQHKGGAGKTTLAAHLAVALAEGGVRVAAVETDPQGSLAGWAELRADAAGRRGEVTTHSVAGWRLGTELGRLRRDHDFVLIDSPPHAETDARAAIRAAELLVVPVQPSPMDVRATGPTLALADESGTPALLVLNRVPPRARLTATMTDALAGFAAPLAESRMGARVALAESMASGLGVTESQPRGRAATEVRALARELRERMSRGG